MVCLQLIVIAALGFIARTEEIPEVFEVIYQWSKLDFTWPDDTIKAKFLDSNQYIPENTTISGVKVWRDKFYLTLPRWRKGVPATLASIPHPNARSLRDTSPKLEPFPSWEMQQVGTCTSLQNVQNIEIHPNGQMWVIDSGRVNTFSQQSDDRCPPKLVIFDISSSQYISYDLEHEHSSGREYNPQGGYNAQGSYSSQSGYSPQMGYNSQGNYGFQSGYQGGYNTQGTPQSGYYTPDTFQSGYNTQGGYSTQNGYTTPNTYSVHSSNAGARVVRTFVFSDPIVSMDSYLMDIVLDTINGDFAYISDASESDPGLIVYSWKENRAWKVRDNRSMRADPGVRSLNVNGEHVTINRNIAGLALSPISVSEEKRRVFYSPLSSYSLFSIPTSILKDESRSLADVSGFVKTLGRKASISEGMTMDSNGILYYGLLGGNAISRWDTNLPFLENQHMITRDNVSLQWPSSFGFDSESGNLTVVSNRLQNFLTGRVNLNEANFRIITAYTGAKSYLYSSTGMRYTTSTQMSTEMYGQDHVQDRSYNDQRETIDQSQQHQITGVKMNENGGERMFPSMTILLLAVAKLVMA